MLPPVGDKQVCNSVKPLAWAVLFRNKPVKRTHEYHKPQNKRRLYENACLVYPSDSFLN